MYEYIGFKRPMVDLAERCTPDTYCSTGWLYITEKHFRNWGVQIFWAPQFCPKHEKYIYTEIRVNTSHVGQIILMTIFIA